MLGYGLKRVLEKYKNNLKKDSQNLSTGAIIINVWRR
jgi:hypothetical protein